MTETKLTREHVKFIRKASKSVCFRYVNGCTTIEFEDKSGIELHIEVEQRENLYGEHNGHMTQAFAMVHTPDFTPEWITVAQFLKPGDVLQLRWIADSNGYVRNASFAGNSDMDAYQSLHFDICRLVVIRKKYHFEFTVATSICPNNSARMIQSWGTK